MAASMAIGPAKSMAMMVTFSVPRNRGINPYRGRSETGCQSFVRSVDRTDLGSVVDPPEVGTPPSAGVAVTAAAAVAVAAAEAGAVKL